MSELPSGTVSLLFSDVEGSTVLLSRLGSAYADALDGQRRVLRQAWADHGGTELGTEGDSFYVVFPTAEGAVAAATQAQRELAVYKWPQGEQVRVRMGIHTGAPTPHDGAYVGMDVHRAARVAGAAHGGQVLISEVTSKLTAECLPEQVTLKDLGSHQLKDITSPERLSQLAIGGLRSDFPPPKTLGAFSSLPRPATALVGRDGEVAELTALLRSPEVRLVTLTGPGGSGKTRLAIALAQGLVERFPDGVYFVDLAAATSSDVMWTTIAEVLDVPPEGRAPPVFFTHLAHRSALLVLDNLEQMAGADEVVVELLREAPQVVVVATSRRPLNVPGELQHAVPPLEVPGVGDIANAAGSGAVQLFAQAARSVRSGFAVTADNIGDVVAICTRLDGLPLAIELAAARSKLLAPHALLARLDKALDLKASSVGRPSRQQTLRDTIAWSYNLLDPQQQVLFRRLGVFAGGADLDAIAAVCGDLLEGEDPLDVVAELVDASLANISESADGEPRVGMLVTVHTFALDRLDAAGETAAARAAHATHFDTVADRLRADKEGPRQLAARQRFDIEADNFREALAYAFGSDDETPSPQRVPLGRRLCKSLGWFMTVSEARRWAEQSVAFGGDSLDLADNLFMLAHSFSVQGDYRRSKEFAEASLAISRQHDSSRELVYGLVTLAWALFDLGDTDGARKAFEEAIDSARRLGDDASVLGSAVGDFGEFEVDCGNHARAHELFAEAIALAKQLGDPYDVASVEWNLLNSVLKSGDLEQAQRLVDGVVTQVLEFGGSLLIVETGESYAELLIRTEQTAAGAGLLGACSAMRESTGVHRYPVRETQLRKLVEAGTVALPAGEFKRQYDAGRMRTVEEVLAELAHR